MKKTKSAKRAKRTSPPPCWRHRLGQPKTVGELRVMLLAFPASRKLAVRNGPLPTIYNMGVEGRRYVEIEIPDRSPPRIVVSRRCAECSAKLADELFGDLIANN